MADDDAGRMSLTEMGIWGKRVRVELGGRREEVWLQTIGDRTEALERGYEAMQRKLLEFRPGGERHEALKAALMLAPTEDLVRLAMAAERHDLEGRVRRELRDPVRPRRDEPAGETEQQFARRAAEHRAKCEEIESARGRRLAELEQQRREELERLPRADLVERALPRRVDIECSNAFARASDDWVLLRAVRRLEDHGEQYFADIAEVQGLHLAVKEQLRRAYRGLEPPEGGEFPKGSAPGPSSGSTI